MTKLFTFLTGLSVLILSACGSDDNNDGENNSGFANDTIEEILTAHNAYRSDVGIGDLTWSNELEQSAQQWADELASNCEFKHSEGEFGENIWLGTESAFTPTDVVDAWGSEIADYTYEDNSCTEGKDCGHYTQIVWENTTEVGCGKATCDGLDIWVCQYNPPGNFVGQKPY